VLLRQGVIRIIRGNDDLEVVGEAGDGVELLGVLQETSPHLVILDITMPRMRGIEVTGIVKARYPQVRVLVLTMHKEYLQQALAAGADGYLLKEDADRDLFSAIDNIRRGRTYLSPRLAGEILGKRPPQKDESLSERELEVLRLICAGSSNREVAEQLFISTRTVESHRARIMAKLGLRSTADLVRYAIQKGLVNQ
jgi:DNA-binding NarL/FixJ family response regulator